MNVCMSCFLFIFLSFTDTNNGDESKPKETSEFIYYQVCNYRGSLGARKVPGLMT